MPDTTDFEHLLEKRNVIAVSYNEETDTVETVVTKKLDLNDLAPEDVVDEQVPDHETDVLDAGLEDGDAGFTPELLDPDNPPLAVQTDRHDRHRPVPDGVSEINARSSAATAGYYPARVADTSAAHWADDADGTLVRLSNNHVYARSNQAGLGESIVQPSPYDGGTPEDQTGELVGYVPLEDGVTVDIAARTSDRDQDAKRPHELPGEWPSRIRRTNYHELVGETLTKTGRTTGVSESTVKKVGASVRVNYPDGPVILRDQIITGHLSEGGDSGSPVFHAERGELVGVLFAGSPNLTILNKVSEVEAAFGVELLTDEPSESGGDTGDDTDTGTGDGSGGGDTGEDGDSGGGGNSGSGGSGSGSGDSGEDSDTGDTGDTGDDTGESDPTTFMSAVRDTLRDEFGPESVETDHRYSDGRQIDFLAESTYGTLCVELENEAVDIFSASFSAMYAAEVHHENAYAVVIVPEGVESEEIANIRRHMTVNVIQFPYTGDAEGV